eukprot:3284263-Alexandrium_andersonii.AAC.1
MTKNGSGRETGDICHVAKSSNLANIMRKGLMPGHTARTSGAAMLQMSPFPPFDDYVDPKTRKPAPRTHACGRVGDP